jgi:phage terminase large subunit
MEEVADYIDVPIELYTPRSVFEPFHDRTQRWAVIIAHRRAGKTVACINDILWRALTETKENARYAYIAPYYAQAKSIAFDYLMQFSEPARVKHNISELWVELFNGARIRLFGADNPDALRGLYLDGVVLDDMGRGYPTLIG